MMFFPNKCFNFFLLSASLLSTVESASVRRSLSEEKILQYTPESIVTDHAALDLDQQAMEEQLAFRTDDSFAKAREIYSYGAHSKSYAIVALQQQLEKDISHNVVVYGYTASNVEIRLFTHVKAAAGEMKLELKYATTGVQDSYSNCQVGKNPVPNTVGCLNATGQVDVTSIGKLTYTYNPLADNKNARTLETLSDEAQAEMFNCGAGCPMSQYLKFHNYYGKFDYAHEWVAAAFEGRATPFTFGNADFSRYTTDGREQAIKMGTALMSVGMWVYREMFDAINTCNAGENDHVDPWDKAVAFYVGSVAKMSNGEVGYMPYSRAEDLCIEFGTCDGSQTGVSHVNRLINDEFMRGQGLLMQKNCAFAAGPAKRIAELMTVPLIQGVLRFSRMVDKLGDQSESTKAEAATYAAAVLPLVHYCSPSDAAIIYDNVRVGATTTSFDAVKKAFENQYSCLGVTCQDVGGLLDNINGGYLEDAKPCGSRDIKPYMTAAEFHAIKNESGMDMTLILIIVVIVLGLCLLGCAIKLFMGRKGTEIEYDSSHPDADKVQATEPQI